eukprot:CAMPEP_0177695422 /NCGR_PEP_ID=MMETSP0484_2-20121128/3448_1 /TAXON_ID=354590 /ORGANISM="Rhodomonas lens, Strain RHODO" /LENGTH=286 /DNA_ID=CAMNT_0019206345 /DNA_START=100 /DNA_END=961 /DNA_ORIENTATION=+
MLDLARLSQRRTVSERLDPKQPRAFHCSATSIHTSASRARRTSTLNEPSSTALYPASRRLDNSCAWAFSMLARANGHPDTGATAYSSSSSTTFSSSAAAAASSSLRTTASFSARPWQHLGAELSGELPKFGPRWEEEAAYDPDDALGGGGGGGMAPPKRIRTVAYQLWARGRDAGAAGQEGAAAAVGAVERALEVVTWAPPPLSPPLLTSGLQPLQQLRRSLTLAASRSGHVERFKGVASRCEAMLSAGAYLHWFTKYGMEDGEIGEAVEELRSHISSAEDVFGSD